MAEYGYLHLGRVLSQDPTSGGYYLESVALARDRRWGPVPSCVAGLAAGDKVVLASTGTSRDSLMILGMLDPRYPDIDDIPGLTAALAAKADQTDLDDAVADIATEHATNVSQAGLITGLDGRLTTNEALDVTQNGRLTTAEGTILSHGTRLTTAEGNITTIQGVDTTQDGRLTSLETWSRPHDNSEFDTFGDVFSSFPRIWGSNVRSLVNNTAYYWITRSHIAATSTRVRVALRTLGVAGNCAGVLYKSSTLTGTYSPIGSGTNTLTAFGIRDFTFTGVSIAPGDYLMALLIGGGYTTTPQITALQNAVQSAVTLSPVWGTKAGLPSAPATVSPLDGTWTTDAAPWWVAIA